MTLDAEAMQLGVDMHDQEIERRQMHEEAFRIRNREYMDTSPEAKAEWEADQAAYEYQTSGRSYEDGLADLKARCPWLFNHDIPEPSDGGYGQDPRIVSTDVDWPMLPNDESGPWWKIA